MALRPEVLDENLVETKDRNLAKSSGVRGLEGRAGHMTARYLTVMCDMTVRYLTVVCDMTVRYLTVMSGRATRYSANMFGNDAFR